MCYIGGMKHDPKKVDSFEKLAIMMADMHEDMDKRFESVDARFEKVEHSIRGIHGELTEINRKLDRIDIRLAALELAVFGVSDSKGKRTARDSILGRLAVLEAAVFKKK